MRLAELLDKANAGYPDGGLAEYFDPATGERTPGDGDALALFVVNELAETYDAGATDGEQLAEAARVLERARGRLAAVVAALGGGEPPRPTPAVVRITDHARRRGLTPARPGDFSARAALTDF